jgi:2-keto-4-pentenoate hydratase/2-oxohepta-3-ene-1,7-dioic acid hydratase in catechol pathway
MRLASFQRTGEVRIGIVGDDQQVFDLQAAAEQDKGALPFFASMQALIESGERGLDYARELDARLATEPNLSHKLSDVDLLPPLPRPTLIRDFSVFPTHIRQAPVGMQKLAARMEGKPVPDITPSDRVPAIYRDQPIYYRGNHLSVVGDGATVRWPRYSRYMDYELEFGIFLGKGGTDISTKNAREHIFGFSIFNDFSARDAQMIEMRSMLGPAKGKDFDTGNAIGPWIVTADEIPDPYSLRMAARVNGKTWSQGDSSGMLHSFEDMIAFASRDETLVPGEFFGSGTMGNGCGLEQDRYLEHGDVVELEVERIGTLRNKVVRKDVQ